MSSKKDRGGMLSAGVTEAMLSASLQREITRIQNSGGARDARQAAWDAYHNRPLTGDGESYVDDETGETVTPTTSTAQSSDVRAMTNAAIAQLVPMLSTDLAVEWQPMGPDDEGAVEAESAVVNRTMLEDNAGMLVLEDVLKEALLLREGWAFVGKQETHRATNTVDVSGMSRGARADLLAGTSSKVAYRPIEGDENGLTEVSAVEEFTFRSVPVDRVEYDRDALVANPDELGYFAEVWYPTRSELIGRGYDQSTVRDLPTVEQPDVNSGSSPSGTVENYSDDEAALEHVECRNCYYRYDMDGDGIAELLFVLTAGRDVQVILDWHPAAWVPYAMGSTARTPHALMGEGVNDNLGSVQSIKTAVLRSSEDNLRSLGDPTLAFDPATVAAVTDITRREPGSGIRSSTPDRIYPVGVTDSGAASQMLLAYIDGGRTELGGAAIDMQGVGAQLAGETAHGIERQYAAKELMMGLYATNFGETFVRRAWGLMHRALRAYSSRPVWWKRNGNWEPVDPTQWPSRTRMTVHVGKTVGARAAVGNALRGALDMSERAMTQGGAGIITDWAHIHRLFVSWATLMGAESADTFLIDPDSEGAIEAAKGQQAAQQQAAQAEIEREQMVVQQQAAELAAKLTMHAADKQSEQADRDNQLEMTRMKILGDAGKQRAADEHETRNRALDAGRQGEAGGGDAAARTVAQ